MSHYSHDKYVSWDDIQAMCRHLATQIHADHPEITRILAITRGGLFPAGILARELNIRMIETVGMESYNEQDQGSKVTVLKPFSPDYAENVLVVDDLADTGNTLTALRKSLINPIVATLFVKPLGAHLVDYYIENVPQSTWVRFPWDTTRQYVPPLVS